MPLFSTIGAALKIGGKALSAIVSKAKAKRAEKKLARAKARAEERTLEVGALGAKLGITPAVGTRIGGLTQAKDLIKKVKINPVAEMVEPVPTQKPSNRNLIFGIVGVVVAIVLFMFFKKR